MGDVIIDGLTGANRLVILDANGKIPALDGSAVTNVAGANFSTGTIPVARLDTGTTAGKIVKLDGTAKLPAVSGAALTGVAGATKNASDPTLSTNPSGGVGTEWHNTTSGEVYVCTDATAGENVWKNVGEQSGNIPLPAPPYGENYGFVLGGPSTSNVIQRFSFTTDGNGADWGDLTTSIYRASSSHSATYGYRAGGMTGGSPDIATNVIDRFAFASQGNAADWADLAILFSYNGSFTAEDYGYPTMGNTHPWTTNVNIVMKYPFASQTNSTDIADMSVARMSTRCASSLTHGYCAGGASPFSNVIDKFNFSTEANGTDVGDINSSTGYDNSGTNSETHGYCCGGQKASQPDKINTIDKWTFASDANATNVGTISSARTGQAGNSSTTHGYCTGDHGGSTLIQKYSFASDGSATNVGNLVTGLKGATGCND